MIFDPNKSIILLQQGQSGMSERGFWSESSSVGLYNKYNLLKSTNIHPNLFCRENFVLAPQWNSDRIGDLYEPTAMFGGHTMPTGLGINMMFSFTIELMEYLDSISFTKNVYYLNHALGGTSLRSISGDCDWSDNGEIFYESAEALKQCIKYEQDTNGNSCQVFEFWHQGESDLDFVNTQLGRLNDLYTRQKNVIGFDHEMFVGYLLFRNQESIDMNIVFDQFDDGNSHVHVVGKDLASGNTIWEQLAIDDPTGFMNPADFSTYHNTGDAHMSWRTNILMGLQLWDLFTLKILT